MEVRNGTRPPPFRGNAAETRRPLYAFDSDWTSSNDKPVAWAI